MPAVLDSDRANSELFEQAAETLPWLVWKQRIKMFHELHALATSAGARSHLIRAMSEWPDARAAEPLWDILANPKASDADEVRTIHLALMMTYLGERYYSSSNISAAARRAVVKAAKPRAAAGGNPAARRRRWRWRRSKEKTRFARDSA